MLFVIILINDFFLIYAVQLYKFTVPMHQVLNVIAENT